MALCRLGFLSGRVNPSSYTPSLSSPLTSEHILRKKRSTTASGLLSSPSTSSSFHHWNSIQGRRLWMSSSTSPLAAGNDDDSGKKEGKTFGEMLENFDEAALFDQGAPVDEKSLTDLQKAERRALLAYQNYRPGSQGADLKLHKYPEFRGEDKDEVHGVGGFGGEVDYSVEHDENSDVEGDVVRKALDQFESPKDGTLYNEHFRRFDRGYPRFDGYWERKRQVKQAEADGLVIDDISKFMAKVLVDAHSVDSSSLLQKQYIQTEVNAFARKLREGKDAKLPKEAEEYMVKTYGKDWRENKEEWGDGVSLTNWDEYELLRTKQHGQYSKNNLKEDPLEDIAMVEEMNEMFKNFPFRLEDGEGIESLLYYHPQFESMGDGGRQFYHHEPPSRIQWVESQLHRAKSGRMSKLGSEGGLVGALGNTPDSFDSGAGEEGGAAPAEGGAAGGQGEGDFYMEDENYDEYNEKPMNAEGGAAEGGAAEGGAAEGGAAEGGAAEGVAAPAPPAEEDPADFDFFRRGEGDSALNLLLTHEDELREEGSRRAARKEGGEGEEGAESAPREERDLDEGMMKDNWGSGRMGSNEQTGEDDWAEGKKRPNVSILKLIWGGLGPSWEDMQMRIEKQAEYYRDPSLHGRVSVKTKREIYSLYSRNPLMWSVNKLSRKFGLRKIRIQAIIDMYSQEAKEDEEFGDGWSNIHDDNGNTIDLETELQAMFPNYVADRIDDRWLLRHHTDGLVATSTIDDQVDLHKYTKDYRKAKRNPGRRKWFSNRRLPVPEEELPDHILVPPEFKMTFKFNRHFKEEIVLIDESPEYEDHQRPMFLVKQDGTVWTVPWKMRRQYLIAKSPLPRTALGMHKEMQFNIDLPAPFDADGMKPELGQDVYGIEHQQQAVTTEHNRKCTSFEDLAQEDLEDEEYNQDLIRDINEQIMEMEHAGEIYHKKLKTHWRSLEKLADYMDSNFCSGEEEHVWA